MFQIGDKLTEETYPFGADWCNQNGCVINPVTWIIEKDTVQTVDNYATRRMAEYPSVQEQLDMLYWDKINGTNNWLKTINEIKRKYPKK